MTKTTIVIEGDKVTADVLSHGRFVSDYATFASVMTRPTHILLRAVCDVYGRNMGHLRKIELVAIAADWATARKGNQ